MVKELDFSKLRGRIIEKYGTLGKFADAMGMCSGSLSKKLRGTTAFDSAEICKALQLLSIDKEDVSAYFFTPKVNIS